MGDANPAGRSPKVAAETTRYRYARLPLVIPDCCTVEDLVSCNARVDALGRVVSPKGRVVPAPGDGTAIDAEASSVPQKDDIFACPRFSRGCRLVAISDTHSLHRQLPPLPKGDLLVHCGDFTNNGTVGEYSDFGSWLARVSEEGFGDRVFCLAGNHDAPQKMTVLRNYLSRAELLQSQMAKRRLCPLGLRMFGQSWPDHGRCLPRNGLPRPRIDVLLSHSPPRGVLDQNINGEHCGSSALLELLKQDRPRLHLFGHIHEGYGARLEHFFEGEPTLLLNISNAARPLGFPPIVPTSIQYPITIIDIELPFEDDSHGADVESAHRPKTSAKMRRLRRRSAADDASLPAPKAFTLFARTYPLLTVIVSACAFVVAVLVFSRSIL
eukprot:TRINITY_DN44010_c0_g1_i1.p1 TRINITY_DN44010_c0_g1~~TRINITY_DN44010_c0_g1_i1.p1  ORF type:complete len:382 (-),score=24.98 TRINITY_DN44010_c0_g1_i1:269-1414(-)